MAKFDSFGRFKVGVAFNWTNVKPNSEILL